MTLARGRLVGLGGGRFELVGAEAGASGPPPPAPPHKGEGSRNKPTLMAQAAMRAAERARDARLLAENLGAGTRVYGPAPFLECVGDMCRWPIAGGLFCGAKRTPAPGQPYCEAHRARSRGTG